MAVVNTGADVDMELKKQPSSLPNDREYETFPAKSPLQQRSLLEKILLLFSIVLIILCIIFIALYAKEKNDSSGTSKAKENASTSKLTGSPPELTSILSGAKNTWSLTCMVRGDPKPVLRINIYNDSGDLIEQHESEKIKIETRKSYQCSAYNEVGAKVGKFFKIYSKNVKFGIDKEWKEDYADENTAAYKQLKADVIKQVKGLYPETTKLSIDNVKFRSGSVMVSFDLMAVATYQSDIDEPITKAIEKKELGNITVVEHVEKADTTYKYSEEANRVKLKEFLLKVQTTFYEYSKYQLPWKPKETDEDIEQLLKDSYRTYNNSPDYLKQQTDTSFALLEELNAINMDENKLKPREMKAIEQVRHFLGTVFGSPYDENFYNGDWMMGPNHFCWQQMCSIPYHISAFAYYITVRNLDDLRITLDRILENKQLILQFKSNMQLGVKVGMVRSIHTCTSGRDALRQVFPKIFENENANDVLNETFAQTYLNKKFIDLPDGEEQKWFKEKGKTPQESLKDAIIEGIGEPVIDLMKYIDDVHLRHCLPEDLASGMANLPVDYIYLDGKQTANKTTKTLPLTNIKLNGSNSYKNMLLYFTTSNISPERVNEIGHERLAALYPQVIEVAKSYTNKSDDTEAVREFRKLIKEQKMFYNDAPFPEIESNGTAHKRCRDAASAEKYCPKRWQSLLKWENTCRQTMAMLSPKIIPLFYHTGERITVPNCPIDMLPSFNPSSGAQFFMASGSHCTVPAKFGLPFFLENHGPRFSEWSVTAHEAWPGHHTQVQGHAEYFKDPYGGVPKWIDEQTYYTFFTEGWGLYAENPVIAQYTDTYKNNPLQRYGMLKWQIWRALRLIVDTGLHYRGMNRTEALGYFSKYAWDDTDLARKELTRYQGTPGQATAYMLGQQKIYELLNKTKTELGKKFKIQEFHYQTLSQGSAPETYLVKYIEKYIDCTLERLVGTECDVILKPVPRKASTTNDDVGPPKPPKKHYY